MLASKLAAKFWLMSLVVIVRPRKDLSHSKGLLD